MILDILKYVGLLVAAGTGAFVAAACHLASRAGREAERDAWQRTTRPDRSTPTTGVRSAQPHIVVGRRPPPSQRSRGDGGPDAAALTRQLETALTDLGDFETMDQENADLRAQLAAAEKRAEMQRKRAERLAQAIMGLCEGDANDIEFELDLYPLDLYDQTGGDFLGAEFGVGDA